MESRTARQLTSITCDHCKSSLPIDGADYPNTAEIYCYTREGLTEAELAKGIERCVWFDICRACFFGWLVPLFAAQGVAEASDVDLTVTGAIAE